MKILLRKEPVEWICMWLVVGISAFAMRERAACPAALGPSVVPSDGGLQSGRT